MQVSAQKSLVIHAPNVHTGGGLVLLQELLGIQNLSARWIQLDQRIQNINALDGISYVKRSIIGRFIAEWKLLRKAQSSDTVLCFHGLPPLFPISSRIVVFLQNRILLDARMLTGYPFITKIRILVERLWLKTAHRTSIKYIVQTPSMQAVTRKYLGDNADIVILPFAPSRTTPTQKQALHKKYDFVYVASGEAHKNHINLLEAWRLLALNSTLRPSLALTIDCTLYPFLTEQVKKYTEEFKLNIFNLGQMDANGIADVYLSSSAVIFPSLAESLGLPLIEAARYDLPILASELDYVRDIALPVQTFNPNSAISIERAVKRFLNKNETMVHISSVDDFLTEVLK